MIMMNMTRHDHDHEHGHAHTGKHDGHAGDLRFDQGPAHAHAPGMSQERMVRIEQDILSVNNAHAAENRRWFAHHGVFALNLVSSPGAGKTSLLVRTIEALREEMPVAVIEGDQQTHRDADRIRATGAGRCRSIPARAAISMRTCSATPCSNWSRTTAACC